MKRAEALQQVWAQVARVLRRDLEAEAGWLERFADGDTIHMRAACASVARIAERCAAAKSGSRTTTWHRKRGGA